MIRERLELYYHRWQLRGDRQVMLRGKDKRLWHYVWRVKDSQSKLELLLLDQYFSVQHLSWLLVRGFCRYEHWESKINWGKNDCCCSLTCGLLKLFRFRIHNSFFTGPMPVTWKQDKTHTLYGWECVLPSLPPHPVLRESETTYPFSIPRQILLDFFVPHSFLHCIK